MDSEKNTLRTVFRNACAVIIDEVSMMSLELTAQLDVRLREITYKLNEPFAGLDVIMCGDRCQLPPVKASEMYVRSAAQLKSITKELPWHHHLAYFPPRRESSDRRTSATLRFSPRSEMDVRSTAKSHCSKVVSSARPKC